jgi:ribonuclease Z
MSKLKRETHFTLTGASSALFSTWFFVEELGILLDAGDGVSASLRQAAGKIKHIFVTHADRDHVTGLLQLHQLNARDGIPRIYYPRDSGSFPALKAFVGKFDPQSGPATWRGLAPGEVVELAGNLFVRAERSEHVDVSNSVVKALRFIVGSRKRVLRKQYQGLSGTEIVELKKKLGETGLTEEISENLLGYSGDCPNLDPAAWTDVRILLHECTFLETQTAKRPHASLVQVLEAARSASPGALVLYHFSSRYTQQQIFSAVTSEANRLTLPFPVYAVVPGELCTDILSREPLWSPAQ